MKEKYESLVFLQGDDYDEAMRAIGAYVADDPNVIYTYREQWDALYRYLLQWEDGEGRELEDTPSHGEGDEFERRDNYIVSWNARLGYCGIDRITSGE